MHLRAAATLTSQMVKIRLLAERNSRSSRDLFDWADTRFLSAGDQNCDFSLLSAFVWCSMFLPVFHRRNPYLELDHISMLENGVVKSQDLTGCETGSSFHA